MRGLILKDLLFIKNSWKNLVITYISSFILSIILNNYLPVICVLPLMLTTSGINAFQTDEFYLTESYSLTFPIDRKTMVLSRYLFTFLLLIISLLIGFSTYILVYLFISPANFDISIMGELLVLNMLSLLFNIMFYPVIYKYGCDKSKYVITSIIMLFMCILYLLINIVDINTIDFNNMIDFLSLYGILIIPLVIIIIVLISYFLSVKFFMKNDY